MTFLHKMAAELRPNTGRVIAGYAMECLDLPGRVGGRYSGSDNGPNNGLDCIGHILYVAQRLYGHALIEPTTTELRPQARAETEWLTDWLSIFANPLPAREASEGDILVFRFTPTASINHAAFKVSENVICHSYVAPFMTAPFLSTSPVTESWLNPYWAKYIAGAYRMDVPRGQCTTQEIAA